MTNAQRNLIQQLRHEAERIVLTLNELPKFGCGNEDEEAYRAELIDELNEIEVELEGWTQHFADLEALRSRDFERSV